METEDYFDDDTSELIDANLNARRRQNLLQQLWPDAQRIDDLDLYDPRMWEPSMVPDEVRANWPKEFSDEHH